MKHFLLIPRFVGWLLVVSTLLRLAPASAQDSPVANPNAATNEISQTRPESTHRPAREIVKIGDSAILKAGETAVAVAVILGNSTIDGIVEGDAVVVSGDATVNGTVKGNLVVVMGSAKLGPKAHVLRDAVVVGGTLTADAAARIDGQARNVPLGTAFADMTWLKDWLTKGLLMGRPFPPQLEWAWWVAAAFLLVYLVLTVLFPRPIQSCVSAIEITPVRSFFTGLLVLVLSGPLFFLMIISVVGLLVVPILAGVLIASLFLGKAAVYQHAGRQLGRQLIPGGFQSALPALLIGAIGFALLYLIPLLGFVVWGLASVLAVGAVFAATFGKFTRENKRSEPVPAPGIPAALAAMEPANTSLITDPTTLPRVGFWRRLGATVLDLILLLAVLLVTNTALLFLPLWLAYHVGMWRWKGTTIGGMVFGLKVVRLSGQPLNFVVALVRSLFSILSVLVVGLGFFWAGWTKDKQSWHDLIAGTTIVRVPKNVSLI
jgi:uncharacterized RDD family membrane protein YckC